MNIVHIRAYYVYFVDCVENILGNIEFLCSLELANIQNVCYHMHTRKSGFEPKIYRRQLLWQPKK